MKAKLISRFLGKMYEFTLSQGKRVHVTVSSKEGAKEARKKLEEQLNQELSFEQLLAEELAILAGPKRDLYLDCMSGKPLSQRQNEREKRDGLILFNGVWKQINL